MIRTKGDKAATPILGPTAKRKRGSELTPSRKANLGANRRLVWLERKKPATEQWCEVELVKNGVIRYDPQSAANKYISRSAASIETVVEQMVVHGETYVLAEVADKYSMDKHTRAENTLAKCLAMSAIGVKFCEPFRPLDENNTLDFKRNIEIEGVPYGLDDLRFEQKGLVHLVRMSENQPELYLTSDGTPLNQACAWPCCRLQGHRPSPPHQTSTSRPIVES